MRTAFFRFVRLEMFRESVGLGVTPAANVTYELSRTRVIHLVPVESAAAGIRSSARARTSIRFLACVDAHVGFVRELRYEFFRTDVALERLLGVTTDVV